MNRALPAEIEILKFINMQTWIALFRGVNVGGANIMKMSQLKDSLESVGCQNTRTYIQSGNIVFDSTLKSKTSLHKRVLDGVERDFGFRPKLFLLTALELSNAKNDNPFPDATAVPKSLHFFFLDAKSPNQDTLSLKKLASVTEEFKLTDQIFYLHAPDGIGRSKLAANVERQLGVAVTARNYATVEKLVGMV